MYLLVISVGFHNVFTTWLQFHGCCQPCSQFRNVFFSRCSLVQSGRRTSQQGYLKFHLIIVANHRHLSTQPQLSTPSKFDSSALKPSQASFAIIVSSQLSLRIPKLESFIVKLKINAHCITWDGKVWCRWRKRRPLGLRSRARGGAVFRAPINWNIKVSKGSELEVLAYGYASASKFKFVDEEVA